MYLLIIIFFKSEFMAAERIMLFRSLAHYCLTSDSYIVIINSYSIVYVFTYNNFKKIRVYGSTANNAVSLARPILLNERFLVIISVCVRLYTSGIIILYKYTGMCVH